MLIFYFFEFEVSRWLSWRRTGSMW